MDKKYRFLILEEVPSQNKGEEAILKGIKKSLNKVKIKNKLSLLSFYPNIDGHNYKGCAEVLSSEKLGLPLRLPEYNAYVRLFYSILVFIKVFTYAFLYKINKDLCMSIFNNDFWNEVENSDYFIIGHDNVFGSIYGHVLPFSHLYFIIFGKLLDKQIIIYSASVGPFGNFISEKLAVNILDKVDVITLREKKSYQYLIKIGFPESKLVISSDPAFVLEPIEDDKVTSIIANLKSFNKPIIGMTVSRVNSKYIQSCTGDKYEYYIDVTCKVIKSIQKKTGALIVFLPHVVGPGNLLDDRVVVRDLINNLDESKKDIVSIKDELSCEQLRMVIKHLDILIGERMHSVISAATVFVPCMVVAYSSPRTDGIIGDMLGLHEWVYRCEKFNEEELDGMIMKLWDNRDNIKQLLKSTVPRARDRALITAELIKKNLISTGRED